MLSFPIIFGNAIRKIEKSCRRKVLSTEGLCDGGSGGKYLVFWDIKSDEVGVIKTFYM